MQAMFQQDFERKRKKIPEATNYTFYRRLLVWIVAVPTLFITGLAYLSFIRGGIFSNGSVYKIGIGASGLDRNALLIVFIVYDAISVIAAIFWFIKPRTDAGIKKALLWLNFAIGIVGLLISYVSLTYGGYQAGMVGLGFVVYSLIVGLITGLRG
jgi:hypothetical protein